MAMATRLWIRVGPRHLMAEGEAGFQMMGGAREISLRQRHRTWKNQHGAEPRID